MLQIVDLAANNFTGKLPIKYISNWKAITGERNKAQYQLSPLRFKDNSLFLNFRSIVDPLHSYDNGYGGYGHGYGYGSAVSYSYQYANIFFQERNDVVNIYYQNMVTITLKGVQVELVKIQTIFTSLDFSCNSFDGPIPREIGELKLLHSLNLSHHAFTSQISQSLGKLTNLESLDLSSNKFTGEISVQLAEGLKFL